VAETINARMEIFTRFLLVAMAPNGIANCIGGCLHSNASPRASAHARIAKRSCADDVLLGLAEPRRPKKIATNRLERRLLEIEKLDPKAKRQITQLLDSFIEGQKLKAACRAARRSAALVV